MERELSKREQFAFTHPLRVRWSEVDRQGIVFNPHYFAYADIAMTEYMRAIGYPSPEGLPAAGSDLFAIRAEADYLGSAVYDATGTKIGSGSSTVNSISESRWQSKPEPAGMR